MKKAIKIILIIFLIIIALLLGGLFVLFSILNDKKTNYYKYSSPAGEIEQAYTAMGSYDVSHIEFDGNNELYGKYHVWYPSEAVSSQQVYALVIIANGTGATAPQYKELFEHLASWGFIVAGNEDENSRSGESSAAMLDHMLRLNEDKSSIFYGKIDTKNIGVTGHSQGGVGAINAVSAQENGSLYKAIFTVSATSPYWGQDDVFGAEWSYDMSKVGIPCFMASGAGAFDAGTAEDISAREGQGICPLWGLEECYSAMPDTVSKIIARAAGKDHGDMLYCSDGYMTAWFMYWLQGDEDAGRAFFGESSEILSNSNWQDVMINQ